MGKKLLTRDFFARNPVRENSAQRFVYSLLLTPKLEEVAKELLREYGGFNLDGIQAEQAQIAAETTPDGLLKWLRRGINKANSPFLCERALEFEPELLPAVLDMLVTTGNVYFIENATRILARCKADPTQGLMERFDRMRDEYAKSMMCIVLGFRGGAEIIPWMLERYRGMKARFPKENHSEGPLLALYELNARFPAGG